MVKELNLIHSGEILREEFMVPLGISSSAMAIVLKPNASAQLIH